jgi:hypothetical protein
MMNCAINILSTRMNHAELMEVAEDHLGGDIPRLL